MRFQRLACVAIGFLAACTPLRTDLAGPRTTFAPAVDHHQHILGPTALPPRETLLPFVDAPPELERLLQARAKIYANAKSASDLADVFTTDATMLTWNRPSRWVRGETDLLDVVNRVVPQPYHFRPHAYDLGTSHGSVSGIVEVGTTDGGQYALDFLWGVRKGTDGLWRIASESTTIRYAPPHYRKPITAEKVVADLDAAGSRSSAGGGMRPD